LPGPRKGSGLGREGQVYRPKQAVALGGRDRYPGKDRQWPGEGGTHVLAGTSCGLVRRGQVSRPGLVAAWKGRDKCLGLRQAEAWGGSDMCIGRDRLCLGKESNCLGQYREWTGEGGQGVNARTGSDLGREGQVFMPGQAVVRGGRDR